MTRPLLGHLPSLFALLTPNGERQCAKPLLTNLLTALETVAEVALIEASERVIDLVERLRLHLNESQLDVFLDVGLGTLDIVQHVVQFAAPRPLGSHMAHLALDFGVNLTPPVIEHLLEF